MSDGVSVTSNAAELAAQFSAAGLRAGAQGSALVRHYGMLLNARVKANAAGRPGPRQVTGDYSRSITLAVSREDDAVVARVGTNRPQGPRLEFGFVGQDSLGRHFHNRPLPHFGPAIDDVSIEFERAVADLAITALDD